MQTLLVPAVPDAVASTVPPAHLRDERPRLSSSTLRALCDLLDAQLWYWGQDIHHPAGNALARYGFQRVRGPDDGTQRSSAYVLASLHSAAPLHGLRQIVAWGFGISADHAELAERYGHVSLVRHENAPGLCATPLPALAGTRDLLPKRSQPRSAGEWHCLCTTITAVAHCCADFERWARQPLGPAHREEARRRRPRAVRRRNPQPAFLDEAWRILGDRIAAESHAVQDAASVIA